MIERLPKEINVLKSYTTYSFGNVFYFHIDTTLLVQVVEYGAFYNSQLFSKRLHYKSV